MTRECRDELSFRAKSSVLKQLDASSTRGRYCIRVVVFRCFLGRRGRADRSVTRPISCITASMIGADTQSL